MIPQAETVFKLVAEILKDEELSNKKKLALQRYFVRKFVPLMTLEEIAKMSGHKGHENICKCIKNVESDPDLIFLKRKVELYFRTPKYTWLKSNDLK